MKSNHIAMSQLYSSHNYITFKVEYKTISNCVMTLPCTKYVASPNIILCGSHRFPVVANQWFSNIF